MKHICKLLFLFALLAGLATSGMSQVALPQTTLTSAVTTTSGTQGNIWTVASVGNANMIVGNFVYADKESAQILAVNATTNQIRVLRGQNGTAAQLHNSGAVVSFGPPNFFTRMDPNGSCALSSVPPSQIVTPLINVTTGNAWSCDAITGNWAMVIDANQRKFTDGYVFIPAGQGNCITVAATTAITTGPAIVRAAANNPVYSSTTNTTAGTLTVTCDLSSELERLTTNKGILINDVTVGYGYQTTALATIGTPSFSSVSYPAAGGTPAGTVVAAGGSLTVTVGTSHSSPGAVTTTGQCYEEKDAFGTPFQFSDLQKFTYEQVFTTAGTTATTLQVCGFAVHYTWFPL